MALLESQLDSPLPLMLPHSYDSRPVEKPAATPRRPITILRRNHRATFDYWPADR